ncbi:MAG: DUF4270 domain-containing protein [Bacteroidota bacterium]
MLLSAAALSSCKKDDPGIGLDLVSGDQLHVRFSDTTSLVTHTIAEDSQVTTGLSSYQVGHYDDPVFGRTVASVYSQLLLPSSNVSFGTAPVLDSIVLTLAAKSYYGTNDPITFRVYEITEGLSSDSSYFSNSTLAFNPTPLADYSLVPNTADSVQIGSTMLAPHIRIPLSASFGNYLLSASTSNYTDNTAFTSFLKGLYITAAPAPTSGNRAIYSLHMSSTVSGLTLYYTESSTPKSFQFTFNGAVRFNHYTHDYSTATPAIAAQLASAWDVQSSQVFIQGLIGLRTKINLPYIGNYLDSGTVAINKAELIIKASTTALNDNYPAPANLILVATGSDSSEVIIPDLLEGSSYFGGVYDATNKEYRFNIARYIQGLMNGTIENHGLYLVIQGRSINANRVVLEGGDTTNPSHMRLKLTYTRIE